MTRAANVPEEALVLLLLSLLPGDVNSERALAGDMVGDYPGACQSQRASQHRVSGLALGQIEGSQRELDVATVGTAKSNTPTLVARRLDDEAKARSPTVADLSSDRGGLELDDGGSREQLGQGREALLGKLGVNRRSVIEQLRYI